MTWLLTERVLRAPNGTHATGVTCSLPLWTSRHCSNFRVLKGGYRNLVGKGVYRIFFQHMETLIGSLLPYVPQFLFLALGHRYGIKNKVASMNDLLHWGDRKISQLVMSATGEAQHGKGSTK